MTVHSGNNNKQSLTPTMKLSELNPYSFKAQRLLGQTIHLSPLLEQKATPEQKRRKIDIADLLLEKQ